MCPRPRPRDADAGHRRAPTIAPTAGWTRVGAPLVMRRRRAGTDDVRPFGTARVDSRGRGPPARAPVTVPSADPEGSPAAPPEAPGITPSRESAAVDDLLRSATEEAARLLGADGAILYLLDAATGKMRFTHDAGIGGLGPDHWIRTLELDQGVGLFGRAVADRKVVVTGDYGARRQLHPCRRDRPVRARGRHPVAGRRADGGRRRHVRGARRVRGRAGGVHRAPGGPGPGPRRPRRARDGQRPAHRRARAFSRGRRPPGDRRALAARAGHPDLGRPRPRGGGPAHDRGGAPAARRRRRPDRHRGPRGEPAARALLGRRGGAPPGRLAGRPRRQPRGRGERPRGAHRPDLHQPRLPDRREPRPRARAGHVRAGQGHPRRHRHAAVRRPGPVRCDHGLVDPGGRVPPGRRGAARDHRRASPPWPSGARA